MTWSPGRDRIADLLASGELESVAPDTELAVRLLTDSKRHLETARSAVGLGDLTGAYQLAYDALRKAAAALLAVQGLRPPAAGGTSRSRTPSRRSSGARGHRSVRSAESGAVATPTSTPIPTRLALTTRMSTTR